MILGYPQEVSPDLIVSPEIPRITAWLRKNFNLLVVATMMACAPAMVGCEEASCDIWLDGEFPDKKAQGDHSPPACSPLDILSPSDQKRFWAIAEAFTRNAKFSMFQETLDKQWIDAKRTLLVNYPVSCELKVFGDNTHHLECKLKAMPLVNNGHYTRN